MESAENFSEIFDFDSQIAKQNSVAMMDGFIAKILLMVFISFFVYVYLYSVLGDVIARFRKKSPPRIAQSLT